jgi:Twisted gastrulation (Tsg) protein conserved region
VIVLTISVSDLCPKPSDTKNPLSKQSHYEQLEGIPGLFNALLEDADDDKWSVFTFPVDYDTSLYGPNSKESQFYMREYQIS